MQQLLQLPIYSILSTVATDALVQDRGSLYSIQYKFLDFQGAFSAPLQDRWDSLVKKEANRPITLSRYNTASL